MPLLRAAWPPGNPGSLLEAVMGWNNGRDAVNAAPVVWRYKSAVPRVHLRGTAFWINPLTLCFVGSPIQTSGIKDAAMPEAYEDTGSQCGCLSINP
ncbi:hypothetical protein [Paenibacillus sp. 22594]|uniref:hypothetical protein n=1 Tax=Paenibacillus sp. 22594 TaxID=3453947 RepID=UPI003F836857